MGSAAGTSRNNSGKTSARPRHTMARSSWPLQHKRRSRMTARMNRRLYGFFAKRLDEAGLELVPDGRDDRGKRWDLGALLRTVLGAMLTGARSLADVEEIDRAHELAHEKVVDARRPLRSCHHHSTAARRLTQTLHCHALLMGAVRTLGLTPCLSPHITGPEGFDGSPLRAGAAGPRSPLALS